MAVEALTSVQLATLASGFDEPVMFENSGGGITAVERTPLAQVHSPELPSEPDAFPGRRPASKATYPLVPVAS